MLTFTFGKDKETKYDLFDFVLNSIGVKDTNINFHIEDNYIVDTLIHTLDIIKGVREKNKA